MRIYFAARFDHNETMRAYKYFLSLYAPEIEITSRWIQSHHNVGEQLACLEDIEDIRKADAILFFSEKATEYMKGGRHVEFGIALALSKTIWVIGDKENVFHYHPFVQHFNSFIEWFFHIKDENEKD
jgi:nucleoside 2-deoxyribosyltransferase